MSMAGQMQPTMRRPVPLRMRPDLQVVSMPFRGTVYRTIKDPISLKYHRLREEQYYVLTQLDGRRTPEQVRQLVQQRYPSQHWALTDLQSLIGDLHEKRLVISQRSGQAEGITRQKQKTRRQKILSGLMSLLFMRFPGIYPEPFLRRTYPLIRWMFHPLTVLAALTFVASAMCLLLIRFQQVMQQMPEFQQFFGWPNLLYLGITMAAIKVLHELGHGYTCHHFGAESHSIGIMLLVFSPTLYCDVSDSWMLRNKWYRILIAAAGVYVEVILSAVALYVWWYTDTGLLHHLALNVFFVTTVSTVIFNLNPLMRFDGYYLLSDLLEIPNLQQRCSQAVQQAVGWYCFGIEPRPDPFEPVRGRGWIIAYAVGSAVYRVFVMAGIGFFLYTVLKPYRLQSLGILMSCFSIGMMVGQFVWQVIRMIRAPRSKPLSRPRMFATAVVLGLLTAAVLQIPVPAWMEAAVMVQPHNVHHVYTSTPGTLSELRVVSGDQVTENQVLAVLTSPELEDRLQQLQQEIREQVHTRKIAVIQGDAASAQLAQDARNSREAQLQEVQKLQEKLILQAPLAGTVVSAERQPAPKHADDDYSMDQWHGDALDPANLGALLQNNTHVCSIAPDQLMEAILFVDQADRNDLQQGQKIRLRFDHLPDQTYEGTISEISAQAVAYVPSVLSNKTGGPLPTVTEEGGRERLTSLAWKATVVLDQDADLFVTGLRGRARVVIADRSLGQWLQRWFHNTVHFRL